jgi:phage gp29-like protein
MSQQGALVQKILRDAHFSAVNRDLVNDAASLDWEIQPAALPGMSWKEMSAAQQKAAEKGADFVANAFAGIEQWDELLTHLIHGETFLTMAEIQWDDNYLPRGFELIDWRRQAWDTKTNQLRLLTASSAYEGIELPANGFIVYRSGFTPGSARDAGLWRALVLLYLIKHYTVTDWLMFAEKFGKPIPIAFYDDETKRPSIIKTLQDLSTDFAGVFPEGTRIDLKEAQRYGTINVFSGLQQLADDSASKLYLGHVLIADAKPGAGTLAGEGARKTNLKILRAVARRLGATLRSYLARPLLGFHHGWDAAENPPQVVFKWEPPADGKLRAETFVAWNEALEPTGQCIDPEHIREQANVPKLVPRAAQPAAAPDAADDPASDDTAIDKEEKADATKARVLLAAAAKKRPALADPLTLERVTTALMRKQAESITAKLVAAIDAAPTLEAALDAVLEAYDETTPEVAELTGVLADAVAITEMTGRGDADGA